MLTGILLVVMAMHTAEAQLSRNRNDLKMLNAATGKDTNTVYTTAVDNADVSLGGVYADGVTVTGTLSAQAACWRRRSKFKNGLTVRQG